MTALSSPAEQRTVLHEISWDTYEAILRDHEDRSAPRFTYDRGTLEIMSPQIPHERYNRFIQLLVQIAAERLDLELYSFGSTTCKREDLERGIEADSCFYAEHGASLRAKDRLDLNVDPPPDLAVEIDITHSSLDKLGIYGALGVPEVWRYDGERVQMLVWIEGRYVERPRSRAIPAIESAALADLLRGSLELDDIDWLRRGRAWADTLR